MKEVVEEKQIPVRLYLLHGTWAAGAPWTKSASKLVTALREIAEPSPIEWKGKNRDTDRRSAAEQVIDTLHQQQGRQILIAHSHGGNVAVNAAADAHFYIIAIVKSPSSGAVGQATHGVNRVQVNVSLQP